MVTERLRSPCASPPYRSLLPSGYAARRQHLSAVCVIPDPCRALQSVRNSTYGRRRYSDVPQADIPGTV